MSCALLTGRDLEDLCIRITVSEDVWEPCTVWMGRSKRCQKPGCVCHKIDWDSCFHVNLLLPIIPTAACYLFCDQVGNNMQEAKLLEGQSRRTK